MRALIFRHGATAGNLARRYIGRSDEPLCARGVEAARACGEDPSVRKVYVSPRTRCVQTAALWYPGAERIPIDGLAEMDFGAFENRTHDELLADPAYQSWLDSGCEAPCPGGEDKASFSDRACAAFAALAARALEEEENQMIVVAHGGVAMAVLDRFTADGRGYFQWRVAPCEGYELWIDPPTWGESRLAQVVGRRVGGAGRA